MSRDLIYWIALTSIKALGPLRIKNLLDAFGSPGDVFRAPEKDLTSVDGIGAMTAAAIKEFDNWKRAEAILRMCDGLGIKVIHLSDPGYPLLLKEVGDCPFILYVKGDISEEDRFAIAVVGPRKPTEYGKRVADMLAGELSLSGLTIVSGMARGIDTVAHVAALKRGGRTFAVLGSGIDVPYPPENAGLMKRIERDGAVITEFPPGTKPERENFPMRNRIISGLSLGVLVVEATDDSGALITSRSALEQGREVFAVPGMITSDRSSGTNTLIKSGAVLVEGARDIIEEIAPQLRGFIREKKRQEVELTKDERSVVSMLSPEPRHIDELARQSTVPTHRLLGVLTELELKGVVRQFEGKRFGLEV